MGTLERIRKTSPFIIGAFAIILIAFFVISDIDPNNLMRNRAKIEEIAIVNGTAIPYKDFEQKARMYEEQQRAANKNNPNPQEVDGTMLRTQLYQQFVDKILINQEAEKAGAQVTNGAITDILLENPPQEVQKMFADSTGKFNKEAYVQYMTRPEEIFSRLPAAERKERLASFRETMTQIQENIADQMLYNNMQTLIATSSSVISPLYAQEVITSDTSTATVHYIAFDITSVKNDEVKVSDEEIKKYYEQYKNYYTQPEQRKLEYLSFPIVASAADSAEADKKIKRIYESLNAAKAAGSLDSVFKERLGENSAYSQTVDFTPVAQINPRITAVLENLQQNDFAGPIPMPDGFHFLKINEKRTNNNEEVKASHILIKFGNDKQAAKEKIMQILEETKKGDFAELAKKYSEDGSSANGGDLGFFKKGQMVKEFEEAAFSAKPETVVGPVETMFGYHLIKVAEKKNDPVTEFNYGDIIIKPQISSIAKKQIVRIANETVNFVNEKGYSLDSAIKSLSNTPNKPLETGFFTKERGTQVFATPYAGLYAFEADKGKAFGPWEDKNLGYVVAQVVGERKAGLSSFEDKKEEIKNIIIRNKKLDLLKSRAEQAYNNITSKGLTLEAMKSDSTNNVRTAENIKNNGNVPTLGLDYGFTQNAFMLETNRVNAPVRGERAYYIMQITARNIVKAPEIKDINPMQIAKLNQEAMNNAFNMWYVRVHEEAKIEDKRLKIWGPGF